MSADNWGICPKCGTDEDRLKGNGTLREDYEQSMDPQGFYECHYEARCTDCGFKWSFHHDEQAFTPEQRKDV